MPSYRSILILWGIYGIIIAIYKLKELRHRKKTTSQRCEVFFGDA